MTWTKEEQEKYKIRRKPAIRITLSEEDRDYLIKLFSYLEYRLPILSKKIVDIERNSRLILRLEKLKPFIKK